MPLAICDGCGPHHFAGEREEPTRRMDLYVQTDDAHAAFGNPVFGDDMQAVPGGQLFGVGFEHVANAFLSIQRLAAFGHI